MVEGDSVGAGDVLKYCLIKLMCCVEVPVTLTTTEILTVNATLDLTSVEVPVTLTTIETLSVNTPLDLMTMSSTPSTIRAKLDLGDGKIATFGGSPKNINEYMAVDGFKNLMIVEANRLFQADDGVDYTEETDPAKSAERVKKIEFRKMFATFVEEEALRVASLRSKVLRRKIASLG
jgi:hypothetical protein